MTDKPGNRIRRDLASKRRERGLPLAFLEKQCRNWNDSYPIGTTVEYHPVIGEAPFRLRRTVSEASILSGHTAVVWLDGERGCVALDACVPVEGSNPQRVGINVSFSRLQEAIYELRQQEQAALAHDRFLATRDEGRGMENIPTCPHCRRATILIEVPETRQLRFILREDEAERLAPGLHCEWCGSEIDPAVVAATAPRKPATGEWEPWDEMIRRRA
jgi:hypothetical protein